MRSIKIERIEVEKSENKEKIRRKKEEKGEKKGEKRERKGEKREKKEEGVPSSVSRPDLHTHSIPSEAGPRCSLRSRAAPRSPGLDNFFY